MNNSPRRRSWRLLSLAALLSTLIFTQFSANGGVSPTAAQESNALDIAAMVLTPSDLQQAGYERFGLARVAGASSGWRSIGDAAVDSVAGSDVRNPVNFDHLNADLALTGWQRQYRRVLAQPSEDNEHTSMTIFTSVAEFADEAGADAALTILMNGGELVPPGALPIGDQLEVRRFTAINYDLRLALAFQDKNLLGFIEIANYSEREGPELEPAILLARQFQERVHVGAKNHRPGLAEAALHLATFASPAEFEGYWRLNDETHPLYGEDIVELTDRNDALGDAIDVYQFDQELWPLPGHEVGPVYENRLYRFADASAASGLLEVIAQWLADNAANSGGTFDAHVVEDAALVGDESITFEIKDVRWDIPTYGYRIYTRVGAYLARVSLHSSDGIALPLSEALATAQAGCLSAGSCANADQPPVRMSGYDCPPTSAGYISAPAALPPNVGSVPMIGADPARTGVQPGPRPDGEMGTKWTLRAYGSSGQGMAIGDNLIAFKTKDKVYSHDYQSDMDAGYLYVLDDQGNFVWCIPTGEAFADPVIDDGLVFTQAQSLVDDHFQTSVEALDIKTGIVHWSASIGYFSRGYPGGLTVAGGTVYATANQGALYALDQATGITKWIFELGPAENAGEGSQHFSLPAIADGVAYITSGRTLFALDAQTGNELWRSETVSEDEVLGTPSVANDVIFVGGNQTVYAIDPANGYSLWQLPIQTDGGSRLAVADGVLYVSTGAETGQTTTGFVAAVDAATGQMIWQTDFVGYVTTPVIAGDVIYVGVGHRPADGPEIGNVYALYAKVGEQMWSLSFEGPVNTPVVIGGQLYVATNAPWEGKLAATVFALGGSEWPVTVQNNQ